MFQLIQGLKILEKYIQHDTFWEHSNHQLAVHHLSAEQMSFYDYQTLVTLGWTYYSHTSIWSLVDKQ